MVSTGRYYRVTPRFWQDSDVRNEWTEDMRFLALYLMTSPHRNMIGLYYCPITYMENDLQWKSNRLRLAFDSLSSPSIDFFRYDETAQVVFLVNGLKHDSPSNPQQVKGAVKIITNLPTTYLLHDLLDAADSLCHSLSIELRNQIDSESIPNRVPYTVPRIPNTESRTHDTESIESTDVDSVSPADVLALWNDTTKGRLAKATKLTPGRRNQIKARLKESGRDPAWWQAYFERIAASTFCRGGQDGSGWQADLDWATRSEDVVAKVFEGKYDDKKPVALAPPAAPPVPTRTKSMQQIMAEAREQVAKEAAR